MLQARIDARRAAAWDILTAGDDRALAALDRLARCDGDERALWGLDAPVTLRARVEHVETDAIVAAIEELERQNAELRDLDQLPAHPKRSDNGRGHASGGTL